MGLTKTLSSVDYDLGHKYWGGGDGTERVQENVFLLNNYRLPDFKHSEQRALPYLIVSTKEMDTWSPLPIMSTTVSGKKNMHQTCLTWTLVTLSAGEPQNDQHRLGNTASEQLLTVRQPWEPPALWVLLLVVSASL